MSSTPTRMDTRLTLYLSGWNRFANAIVRDSLSDDVVASAKFYAQLNYALANAAIASWDAKYARLRNPLVPIRFN